MNLIGFLFHFFNFLKGFSFSIKVMPQWLLEDQLGGKVVFLSFFPMASLSQIYMP